MVPIQRREARRKRVGRVDHPTIRHGKPSVSGVGSINHCRGIGIPIVNSCKLNRKDFFRLGLGRTADGALGLVLWDSGAVLVLAGWRE